MARKEKKERKMTVISGARVEGVPLHPKVVDFIADCLIEIHHEQQRHVKSDDQNDQFIKGKF